MRYNLDGSFDTTFDRDGKADCSVYIPANSTWYVQVPQSFTVTEFGQPGDRPVPADYHGDGKTDIAVWRPSNGTWYIINSANSGISVRQFGQDGDIPLPSAYIY